MAIPVVFVVMQAFDGSLFGFGGAADEATVDVYRGWDFQFLVNGVRCTRATESSDEFRLTITR